MSASRPIWPMSILWPTSLPATAWPRPYDTITDSIPDFIANCSMTRVFAYLMETRAEITDQAIFADTSRVVGAALARTHAENA